MLAAAAATAAAAAAGAVLGAFEKSKEAIKACRRKLNDCFRLCKAKGLHIFLAYQSSDVIFLILFFLPQFSFCGFA